MVVSILDSITGSFLGLMPHARKASNKEDAMRCTLRAHMKETREAFATLVFYDGNDSSLWNYMPNT
jgi:hypothetical protein